ncbi:MAG: succinylglutamate desuccinylase/aspartoacylase family protein [Bacteroidia bacterium]
MDQRNLRRIIIRVQDERQIEVCIRHNPPRDGTLRGAAADHSIPAITLEVGNPHKFQKGMIRSSLSGIHNLLVFLNMAEGEIEQPETPTVICESSYWLYTDHGGILEVFPSVTQIVEKDQRIAIVRNVFGDVMSEYFAPERGIVIGKSVNPVNQTGSRILHLGIIRK